MIKKSQINILILSLALFGARPLIAESTSSINTYVDGRCNFWSVEVYDVDTAGWLRGVEHTGRDSTEPELKRNQDGSVDLYFCPKPPEGKRSNWIPTLSGKRFFLLFRFYGPTRAVFDKSFQLNDMDLLE